MSTDWYNPNILVLGPFQVRWYGALFVMGFLIGALILRKLSDKRIWPLPKSSIDSYISWMIISMFLGARLFYVFFYHWEHYADHLWEIPAVWRGGLSFHGATLGMLLGSWGFAKKNKIHFFQVSDCLAVCSAPGIFLGRVGNYINGELYGRVTDSWAGVVFPGGGPFPRHPSQLYEAILEGALLFFLMIFILKKQRFYGVATGAFLFFYGSFRFLMEFFREPDVQLGYLFTYFTLGQILSLMMLPFAFVILKRAKQIKLPNPLIKLFPEA